MNGYPLNHVVDRLTDVKATERNEMNPEVFCTFHVILICGGV